MLLSHKPKSGAELLKQNQFVEGLKVEGDVEYKIWFLKKLTRYYQSNDKFRVMINDQLTFSDHVTLVAWSGQLMTQAVVPLYV